MPRPPSPASHLSRWHWHIRGQVQGVGFRPFIYRIAHRAGITGRVLNSPSGVHLEIQGRPRALAAFAAAFKRELPPLARVDSCRRTRVPVIPAERSFIIDSSGATGLRISQTRASRAPESSHPEAPADAAVTIDTAVCPDCFREMFDPDNRRYLHALINCTNCGPRFSIIQNVPYDRQNTTMASFKMCPACRAEYQNPADRRFHAQPVCCPNCGPQVSLVQVVPQPARAPSGKDSRSGLPRREPSAVPHRIRIKRIPGDPFANAAQLLLAGKIVALKGLGGFHLAVRADLPDAVERLRRLKQRDAKPFALMVPDLAAARRLVHLSPAAQAELTSPRAPIILAPRRDSSPCAMLSGTPAPSPCDARFEEPLSMSLAASISPPVAASVAPGTNLLGLMLPYTPLHHLLWSAMAAQLATPEKRRRPHSSFVIRHSSFPPPLVMTSGNLSNEPLVIDNADAAQRLGPISDAILWHDRPIERCVDDSVILDRGPNRPPLPIRRSRGYTPSGADILVGRNGGVPPAVRPPSPIPTGICLGGELKSTVAVVRDRDIILSQHLGDLTDARSFAHFQKAVADLIRLFHVNVTFVAHDLHPSYMSTIAAQQLARKFNARLIPIQHHVAHAHAVMGEHGLTRALAVICDGTGFGTDGSIWGGELLHIDGPRWQRLGRLKPIRLPGGDAAARDPKRSALALLHSVFGTGFENLPQAAALFPKKADRQLLARMIITGLSSPWTSSTGRLFDAVAALLGICTTNDHEARAAMALEAAAWSAQSDNLPEEELFVVRRADLWELDLAPFVFRLVKRGRKRGVFGANTRDLGEEAMRFHVALGRGLVGLAAAAGGGLPLVASGGSFCNRLLERELERAAAAAGIRTYFHKEYPPTDAGLAFGQAIYSRILLSDG